MDSLLDLYTKPESYLFESDSSICYTIYESHIYRSSEAIELIVEGECGLNGHLMSLIIPMSEASIERYREISKELIAHRLPLLSQYEMCRMRCTKMGDRSQPLSVDVITQRLPHGELLSTMVEGASPREVERLYGAVANLERYIKISGVRFRDLRAVDMIYGEDGRLYPFRYDYLEFDIERGECIEECDALRREIEWLSGYSASSWEYLSEESPYSTTLCDVLGGYISCRAASEGLIAVESLDGWGFVDSLNRVVVAPKYLSVTDFAGGRSVVRSMDNERYGVIDIRGEYLMRTIYDSIKVDTSTGEMILCRDGVRMVVDRDGEVKIER